MFGTKMSFTSFLKKFFLHALYKGDRVGSERKAEKYIGVQAYSPCVTINSAFHCKLCPIFTKKFTY